MADAKISALTELTGADVDISADWVPIVDTSTTTTKKVKPSNLIGSPFTTAGDILQASGDGVAARLGIGTAGQVLRVNAGATAVEYATPSTGISMGTKQDTTSGTAVTFTGIPTGVKRITLNINGVSTSGTSPLQVQLGDAGGFETSGYINGVASVGVSTPTESTGGFQIEDASAVSSSSVRRGTITLTLLDAATFSWIATGQIYDSDGNSLYVLAGSKSLSAELTQVRLTSLGGSNTFDAGTANITYET